MRLFRLFAVAALLLLSSNVVADERVAFTASSEYALSSADYKGTAENGGTLWTGELGVQILSDRAVEVPVLPSDGVLAGVTVDGKSAAVFTRDAHFTVLVQGKGNHSIQIRFTTPVEAQGGLDSIRVGTIQTPISRFQLTIPGQKEVRVTPNAVLEDSTVNGRTVVAVNMPMSPEVTFSWSNMVGDGKNAEAKLHATLYHFALPEEGVLSLRTLIAYDFLRGELTTAEIEIPAGFEVTRVQAEGHPISDWRVTHDAKSVLYVTFQEPIKSNFTIDCTVERSLAKVGDTEAKMAIAPLRAKDAARQRGIIALLSGKEVALSPVTENSVMRVGENQIPADIRGMVTQNVLHTFKYLDENAALTVASVTPEKKAGRFNALIHTLFSLGDVSIKGSAKVHIQVKAGTLQELALDLPKGITVLSVTAPSMRNFNVEAAGERQKIAVQFTQEMDGAFPVDVQFERILAPDESEPPLPTLHVENAEVEQGKFAVEALTAVEVQPGLVKQLAPLELTEVPQEILLQTSNPLLLAFKYARYEEQSSAALKVTRHQEVETQPAVVDQAQFDTLVVADGMSVTAARFTVRNTKSQFLRLALPKGATIWSAMVQGENVKPARAERNGIEETLIKIINSRTPFAVEITYATNENKMAVAGALRMTLPKADLIVTRTLWNLYLPDQFKYGSAHTGMTLGFEAQNSTQEDYRQFAAVMKRDQSAAPFAISIPTGGIRYSFTKVLSGETDGPDSVLFIYLTKSYGFPQWLSLIASVCLSFILLGRLGLVKRIPAARERIAGALSVATIGVLVLYFGAGTGPLTLVALVTAGWTLYPTIKRRFRTHQIPSEVTVP